MNFLVKKIPSAVDGNGRKFDLIHAHTNGNWDYSYGIDFLIENGYVALINQQDIEGNTPIHHAAKMAINAYCKHKIILKLIQQPIMMHNVRNDKGRTPLHTACYHGYVLMVQQLLLISWLFFPNFFKYN